MIRVFARALPAACLMVLLLGGCKGKSGPVGKVTPAEGTVQIDGKPAANVIVEFFPDGSVDRAPGSSGLTDETGHYVLTASDGRPGAIVGKHKVSFKNDRPDERSGKTATGPKVPEKYTQPGAENVEVTETKKTYDFKLK